MQFVLHLALAAVIGFAATEARQQEHDIGKLCVFYARTLRAPLKVLFLATDFD